MSFGILTLATQRDYLKAIGLALSLRLSNPKVQLAVAAERSIKDRLANYFDYVIEQNQGYRGFEHKVNLDKYSPFDETLFFDSDVLVFRSVRQYLDKWGAGPYWACGRLVEDGFSSFGLDRRAVLSKTGKALFTRIEGAGHAFFRKPECNTIFDCAREITANYSAYAGEAKYADEDAISIALTIHGIPPAPWDDFFSRYLSAKSGTLKMDVLNAKCSFVAVETGVTYEPCMMHFAADEAPFFYAKQLSLLFDRFNVPKAGLFTSALKWFYRREVKNRLHAFKNNVITLVHQR